MPKISRTKIHVLDTNKEIGKEFLACLLNRNIPSKFEYWGEKETRNWLNLCKDPEYINWPLEISLLRTNLPKIARLVKPNIGNLISLGIGNGEKDKMILTEFLKNRKMRYFTFDISSNMIKTGLRTLIKTPAEKTAYVGDFKHLEKYAPKIKKQTGSGNLVSILGNTFGNLNQTETLKMLHRSMDKNDYLLFTVQILEKKEILNMGEILSAYGTRDWRKLSYGSIMRTGIKMSDGIIEMEFGKDRLFPQLNTIQYFFTFKKDKTLKYLNRKIDFKTNEKIPVYFSYKYDEKNLSSLLNDNGFKIVKSFLSPGGKYLLALAKLK